MELERAAARQTLAAIPTDGLMHVNQTLRIMSEQDALRELERAAERQTLPAREVDMEYLKNTLLQLYHKGERALLSILSISVCL